MPNVQHLESALSPMPVIPLNSQRKPLHRDNTKKDKDIRRAKSNFPAIYDHCQDALTPMIPMETREERTSSYNIMNKNKLNLSTARSEEFEHEFNDGFAWLGDKMKHQQRDRKDKLSIYNESPDNTKKFKSMQESESGSSIFKSSEENGSRDENDIGGIFNENIPEATVEKIRNKIKPYSEIVRT